MSVTVARRLDDALACIAEAFYAVDSDGRLVVFNAAAETYFGVAADKVLGKDLWDIFPRGRGTDYEHAYAAAKAGQAQLLTLPSVLRPSRIAEVRMAPWDGGVCVAISDVTERHRVERELQDSEQRLQAIVSAVPAFIWFADADGAVHFMNERWYEFTGQTPEEALPQGWAQALHPDDLDRTLKVWRESLAGGKSYEIEMRYRRRDGAYRWYIARAEPVRELSGAIAMWFGSSTDIHDIKTAQAELDRERERLKIALLAGQLGVYEWRLDDDSVWWSPELYPLYGVDAATFTPNVESFDALVHPEDREELWRKSAESVDAIAPFTHEYRIIRPDGVERWIANRSHVSVDVNGKAARVTGVAVDITERRQSEDYAHQLMREINHRSKNMLALVQAIARQTAAKSPGDFIPRFEQRIAALGRAQDLLVSSDWKQVELRELVTAQLGHFSSLIGHRIFIEGQAVSVSPAAAQTLAMAVHELATNAAKHGALSSGAGEVRIAWRLSSDEGRARRLEMSWRESGGPPVSPPSQRGFGSTVIEAMTRASLGGEVTVSFDRAGLSWRVACDADGVASELDQAAEKDSRDFTEREDVSATTMGSVLIVEDEALIALEMADSLTALGFSIVGPAYSTREAEALIAGSHCDAAVLDVQLGSHTSEGLARLLRERRVPFVLLSGYAREQLPAECRDAPLLSKPLSSELLAAELRRLVSEHQRKRAS